MTSAIWKLGALKMVCCGGPLLILLVASGAVAVVDVALGAAVLGLVVGWLLWRRRRACACKLLALEQSEQFADVTPGQRERAPRDRVLTGADGEREKGWM